MIVACATDDGKHFISRHFGDAHYYYIFKFEKTHFVHIHTLSNKSGEELVHADPDKAKGITELLKEKNVELVLSKVFGPNIQRIKNHFLPVMVSVESMEDGLLKLIASMAILEESIAFGKHREAIDLRS